MVTRSTQAHHKAGRLRHVLPARVDGPAQAHHRQECLRHGWVRHCCLPPDWTCRGATKTVAQTSPPPRRVSPLQLSGSPQAGRLRHFFCDGCLTCSSPPHRQECLRHIPYLPADSSRLRSAARATHALISPGKLPCMRTFRPASVVPPLVVTAWRSASSDSGLSLAIRAAP